MGEKRLRSSFFFPELDIGGQMGVYRGKNFRRMAGKMFPGNKSGIFRATKKYYVQRKKQSPKIECRKWSKHFSSMFTYARKRERRSRRRKKNFRFIGIQRMNLDRKGSKGRRRGRGGENLLQAEYCPTERSFNHFEFCGFHSGWTRGLENKK